MANAFLERITSCLAEVPGVAAVVLGGSRARGTATAKSDYDLGLHYGPAGKLDTDRLLDVVKGLVDDPDVAAVTPVGGWGPWINGGGWLTIDGREVDLLYRDTRAVARVIDDCRSGRITMDYQPGHPHGFCSAIWMGEVALCQSLYDPRNLVAELRAMTSPYPEELRDAIIRRFEWEVLFSIENGELAVSRGDQTHIAGCTYRALCCLSQVLFALNRRYLINEKGALAEAARLPLTISELPTRVTHIWRAIGLGVFIDVFTELRALDHELKVLITPTPNSVILGRVGEAHREPGT